MKPFVGPYRIQGLLGHGGMGVVYLGIHDQLGREVAIKALAPELTQQPQFRERFFAEARAQAKLQHMNIVTIYDLIEDDGSFFIVMEHVPGPPLAELLEQGAVKDWDVGHSLGLFRQVLAGLDYAHSKGVIHRDVKPSNVLVADGQLVKLTDFGIALLVGDKRLTASLATIGTPTYMSPEQILRPHQVDHRSDVYSAAIVLYEMLAGQPPFDAETEYEIKKLHIEAQVPDVRAVNPGVPPAVAEAIAVALRKDPDERFQSAGAFLRELAPRQETPVPVALEVQAPPAAAGAPAALARSAAPVPARRAHAFAPPWTRRTLLGAAAVLVAVLSLSVLSMRELSRPQEARQPGPDGDPPLAGSESGPARTPLPSATGPDATPAGPEGGSPARMATLGGPRESEPPESKLSSAGRETPSEKRPGPRVAPGKPVEPGPLPPVPKSPDVQPAAGAAERAAAAKRADLQARVEQARNAISAKDFAGAQAELTALQALAKGLPGGFEDEKESVRLLGEYFAKAKQEQEQVQAEIAQGWSEKVQQARGLLAQGKAPAARDMAQQVIDGANVPERVRREARDVAAESLSLQSGGKVLRPGADNRAGAIRETGYRPSDGVVVRIQRIVGPQRTGSWESTFKVRYVALAPDPDEVLSVSLVGVVVRQGEKSGWRFQQTVVIREGGGVMETPITLTFASWSKGAYTLAVKVSESSHGVQDKSQIEFVIH